MRNKAIVVIVILILFFFIGHRSIQVGACVVNDLSSCFLYPFIRLHHAFIEPLYNWYARRTTIEILQKNVQELEQERDALYAELVALRGSDRYAQETRDLIAFNKRYMGQKGIVVHVLARHISDNAHFLLVDAG